MIVTKLEPFERGKDRVAVDLDGEFAFVLYESELSKYEVKINGDISTEKYNQIVRETVLVRAKKRGMNLLKTMDRTQADVKKKLIDGGYTEQIADEVVEYLKSYKYLDDRRYASDYIHFKSQNMSKKQIINKLLEKGIDKNIILDAINEHYEEAGEESEDELIEKLMIKKCRGNITALPYNDKQKLFAFLYNKGFSISDIERVYNRVTTT